MPTMQSDSLLLAPAAPPAGDRVESEAPQLNCRTMSRSFSKSGEDTPISLSQLSQGSISLSQGTISFSQPDDVIFANDILDHVEESLSQVSTDLRTISRKNSRCLEPVVPSQECDLWALEPKLDVGDGLGFKETSQRPSILGKRSVSAGYMVTCDHPYDTQVGLDAEVFNRASPSVDAAEASSAPTPSNRAEKEDPAMKSEVQMEIADEQKEECASGAADDTCATPHSDQGEPMKIFGRCTDFGWEIPTFCPFETMNAEDEEDGEHSTQTMTMRSSKRRRIVISAGKVTRKLDLPPFEPIMEDDDVCCSQYRSEQLEDAEDEGPALTLRLLKAVARTDEGRTLLSLAVNCNKKCRFAYSDPESIPLELREQVLARITYDPSIKGTANRTEHNLPSRDELPPMLESLSASGLLDGICDFEMQVVEHPQHDGGSALRMTCSLDGAPVSWTRQACTSCGSAFSRFMYEEGKYTEFRKITREITAGQQDWSCAAGHTLCEPCYRHFTKYGHLQNPRRVHIERLDAILRDAVQAPVHATPKRTGKGRAPRAHRAKPTPRSTPHSTPSRTPRAGRGARR